MPFYTKAIKRIEPSILIVIVLIVAMAILGSVISDRFLAVNNFINIFDNSVILGLVSLSQSLVILTGGIDLSIAGIVSLTSCLTSGITNGSETLVYPVVVGVMILGTFIGLINGLIVVKLRVNPLIATLGVWTILQGVTLIYTLEPIGEMPYFYGDIAYGRLFGIPVAALVLVFIYIGVAIFLKKMRLGRYIYAVGGNEDGARLSGIRTDRVLIFVYMASGFFASLAGLYVVSRMSVGDPVVGNNYLLSSIIPVVLGGIVMAGGKGHVIGTLLAVYLMTMLRTVLNYMDLTAYFQWIIEGIILLSVVSIYVENRKNP